MDAFDNGIDWLGNDEQSEELNEITQADQRFGWPYVYDDDQINPHTEPVEMSAEQWAELSEEPVGMYTAHSAPMQMIFYGERPSISGTEVTGETRELRVTESHHAYDGLIDFPKSPVAAARGSRENRNGIGAEAISGGVDAIHATEEVARPP